MATAFDDSATSEYEGADLGPMAPARDEVVIENLAVEGRIPSKLRGTFYRNGPNPRFEPVGQYHIFDGDGMIHAIRFTDDGVSYANRWIRTHKWQKEDSEARALFGGFADRTSTDPSVLSWSFPQRSNGNTHTFKHHGKMLALYEAGMPWVIDPVSLRTLGQDDYDGRLSVAALAAHPHLDPDNGDLIWYGTNFDPGVNYMSIVVIDKDNNIKMDLPIQGPYDSFMHDILFTKDYIVVPLQPLTRSFDRAMRGEPYMLWEPDAGAYLGILRRDAKDGGEIRWIRMKPSSFFHLFNSYQDTDGTIIIDAAANEECPAAVGGKADLLGQWERWQVDLDAGTVEVTQMSDVGLDFPRIDERLQGKRHNLNIAVGNRGVGPTIEMNAIYCCFSDTGKVVRRHLPDGHLCSEAVFVPEDPEGEVEKGYVVTLVLDQNSQTSYVLILDAHAIDADPIARVMIPRRIPVGFHANWVSDLPGYPQH